jgi:hypothetical protein
MSHDSPANTVTATGWTTKDSIPNKDRDFSSSQCPYQTPGHSVCYLIGEKGFFFFNRKETIVWGWPLTSIYFGGYEYVELHLHVTIYLQVVELKSIQTKNWHIKDTGKIYHSAIFFVNDIHCICTKTSGFYTWMVLLLLSSLASIVSS